MAAHDDLLPDWLWEEARPLLPVHAPNPKGGRPRAQDRPCLLALVWMVREGGTYLRLPTKQLDCPSYATVWRRLQEWSAAGVWDGLHKKILDHLGREGGLDTTRVVADGASSRALFGGYTPDLIPPTAASKA